VRACVAVRVRVLCYVSTRERVGVWRRQAPGAKPLDPRSEPGLPRLFFPPGGPRKRVGTVLLLVLNCARWSLLVRATFGGLEWGHRLRPAPLFQPLEVIVKRRQPVNKHRSAVVFRKQVQKTKMPNMAAVQRGGIRL